MERRKLPIQFNAHVRTVKAMSQIDEDREIGFDNSDVEELDYHDDDWS